MAINSDKPHLWKADIEKSIDFYNDWFIRFAPETYRAQRKITNVAVIDAFTKTSNLTQIVPAVLQTAPGLLPILRMVTAPPLARDRLMGLAHVSKSMIGAMEGKENAPPRLPSRMSATDIHDNLENLCDVIAELIDCDLIPWIGSGTNPSKSEVDRAATVIADRMCGASSDPIIRNAQEKRQLATLKRWLKKNGYKEISTEAARDPRAMPNGTFTFRLSLSAGKKKTAVNIPIDCVVKPLFAKTGDMPLLIEAKSAGDATNTNKRRKEEAQKYRQLKDKYGNSVQFMLYLCGYFEPGYLGYEAAEGIDWVWEHRTSDLSQLLSLEHKKKGELAKQSREAYISSESEEKEERRIIAQIDVDSQKSAGERNKLGQFSTPPQLASQMVSKSAEYLPDSPIDFLEPSIGTGVFFSSLLRNNLKSRLRTAVGCEIDNSYGDIAAQLWSQYGLKVEIGDFIGFAEDKLNYDKFNLLCTNPPYVRHHHLDPGLKTRLQSLTFKRLGLQPSGLSGLYVYFVLLADKLLANNAIASWLLPAEFLYVNYGKVLRDYLTTRVELISIHHFDPDDVQFEDALVSSCIVTYRKGRAVNNSTCMMSYGGDLVEPKSVKEMSISQLKSMNKWTMSHFDAHEPTCSDPLIRDYLKVRRGIATGANDYFIIDQTTIKQFDIPSVFLKPILPSPRFISNSVIESNIDGTPVVSEPRFLLDCREAPDVIQRRYPGLWAYLQEGRSRGLPERYLCASRDVWYFQEKREPALFLASYMGRSNGSRECPIRFFANFSNALVTNVFLNLYPTPELEVALGEDKSRILEFLNMLNSVPKSAVLHAGRAYGGGLHKIEPKELLAMPIPNAPAWISGVRSHQLALI